MELLNQGISLFRQLASRDGLNGLLESFGPWFPALMFLIIFCETGLVALPFLPGDSLLFALGAICAFSGTSLNIWVLAPLLLVAAILGDAVNYHLGRWFGPAVFRAKDSWLLNHQHLVRAQAFYEKHGGKTVILARFVPIIRTFAPFVAGIGSMNYSRFLVFNVVGGFAWVSLCMGGGYLLGSQLSDKYFELVLIAIVVVSVLPLVFEWWNHRRKANAASA
jgi:membrane-associated protein